MSGDSRDNKSIVEIFNGLHYEEEGFSDNVAETTFPQLNPDQSELNKNLEIMESVEGSDKTIAEASKAQKLWANSSLLMRVNILHKIWKKLQSALKEFPKIKEKLSIFSEYFNYYSDLSLQSEYKNWTPCGVISIVLSNWSSLFAAATIPAALVTGCSVIVFAPKTEVKFFTLLQEIFLKSGLPENLLKVSFELNMRLLRKSEKIFFCGSYSNAQKLYESISVKSFNFVCPNNTGAFILESADFHSAANKIIRETWGKNSSFAISNIIVLESIYEEFIDTLKCELDQFMIENENLIKFNDEIVGEKIQKVVSKAIKAGATVVTKNYRKWFPTVIVNYQSQDIDEDVPILKVLLCRTAKEGITLLNNCRYTLGASLWTEISSQALQISNSLLTQNVWINSHGTLDPTVPIQFSAFSGNCVLGGSYGILEFISPEVNELKIKFEFENLFFECEDTIPDDYKEKTMRCDFSNEASRTWRRNGHHYLLNIANSLADDNSLTDIIHYYISSKFLVTFSNRNCNEEFLTVREKMPIGVILLFITREIDRRSFLSLIMPAISTGNTVVVILKEKNETIESIAENIEKNLPKGLFHIFIGLKLGVYWAGHPNIQAIWLYTDPSNTLEMCKKLKKYGKEYLKEIWIVPQKIPLSHNLFHSKCLKEKVLWLPQIDYFP